MNVAIRDAPLLNSLRPLDVAGFLRARHWVPGKVRPRIAEQWVKDDRFEVLLPLDRQMDGFPVRMAELLGTLERAEQENQFSILSDIREGTADTIRVSIDGEEVADGMISVLDGDNSDRGGARNDLVGGLFRGSAEGILRPAAPGRGERISPARPPGADRSRHLFGTTAGPDSAAPADAGGIPGRRPVDRPAPVRAPGYGNAGQRSPSRNRSSR